MTEEQMIKAEAALRSKQIKDILKRHALERYRQCVIDVPFFLLPHRVLYRMEQASEQIILTRFYPYRAARAETEQKIRAAIDKARDSKAELTEKEIETIKKPIEAIDYTPENMKEYYFTCFLHGFNLDEFRSWDWTGERVSPDKEKELKLYYQRRQRDFIEHPEKYATPALKANDDMSRYSRDTRYFLRMLDDISEPEDTAYWTEKEQEILNMNIREEI